MNSNFPTIDLNSKLLIKSLENTNNNHHMEVLDQLRRLLAGMRNHSVHPTQKDDESLELSIIQSQLSSQLALTFLQFAIRNLSAFVDQNGKFVTVQVLEPSEGDKDVVYYFGFDGDATGDYLEKAFYNADQDEAEVVKRSHAVREAIRTLENAISIGTKNVDVLFAEGDNLLIKST